MFCRLWCQSYSWYYLGEGIQNIKKYDTHFEHSNVNFALLTCDTECVIKLDASNEKKYIWRTIYFIFIIIIILKQQNWRSFELYFLLKSFLSSLVSNQSMDPYSKGRPKNNVLEKGSMILWRQYINLTKKRVEGEGESNYTKLCVTSFLNCP